MLVSLIGYFAAVCTTVSFLPQVIKTIKTRRTKDLSLFTIIIMQTGAILWTLYGTFLKDPAIFFTNLSVFILIIPLLYLKLQEK